MDGTIQVEMRQKKLAEIEARAAAGLGPPEPSPEEVSFAQPHRTKPSRFIVLAARDVFSDDAVASDCRYSEAV